MVHKFMLEIGPTLQRRSFLGDPGAAPVRLMLQFGSPEKRKQKRGRPGDGRVRTVGSLCHLQPWCKVQQLN